jgi:CubicO group peptidase (beta-lactamase class C family)
LARIVQAATGQNTFDFAMQYLFEPLGIQNVGWPRDPQGIVHGWGDLRLTPYDMAKIGYLYLNDGVWDGHQLLPPGWVEDATRSVRSRSEQGYGYLWWLSDTYYAAQGRGGQYIVVVPDKKLIVVMTGAGGLPVRLETFLKQFILPAIKTDEPLAANAAGEDRLQDAVQDVALTPEITAQPVSLIPPLAQQISGRTILDPQPCWIADVITLI